MTTSAVKDNVSFDLHDNIIKTFEKELTKPTPKAKNTEFENEIVKVFSIYKQTIEKYIPNVKKQASLTQEFLPLLTQPSTSLVELEAKINLIQTELNKVRTNVTNQELQITTLQNRMAELMTLDQPAALPEGWLNQFGTSLGSSS